MKTLHCEEALIVLNGPPNLEESVVDWLMAREGGVGFTSFPVFGHRSSHDDLSPVEQVRGRQRRQQFQIQTSQNRVDSFTEDARQNLGRAGVHYWVLPLSSGGHLSGL